MPHERTETVYTFAELDEPAKERARDWYRQAQDGDNYMFESVLEDAAIICKILGVELSTRTVKLMGGGIRQEPQIYFSGFNSQGDGACFEGEYRYVKGAVATIKAHAPQDTELHRIASELQAIQRPHFYKLSANLEHTGRDSHEMSVEISVDCDCRSCQRGNSVDGRARDESIADLLRYVMRWIYHQLELEYEYQHSNEVVDENIIANEYDFDESGRRA